MEQVQDVTQKVVELRRAIHLLMSEKTYADTEIIASSAALDVQLEEYEQALREKRMPMMKSF